MRTWILSELPLQLAILYFIICSVHNIGHSSRIRGLLYHAVVCQTFNTLVFEHLYQRILDLTGCLAPTQGLASNLGTMCDCQLTCSMQPAHCLTAHSTENLILQPLLYLLLLIWQIKEYVSIEPYLYRVKPLYLIRRPCEQAYLQRSPHS